MPSSDELRIAIMRLSRRARAEAIDDAISATQFSVLLVLKHEGAQPLATLAKAERVTPPSMYRTVQTLNKAGLVTQSAHPTDRRKVLIELTEAGTDLIAATRERRSKWFSTQLDLLTADERTVLETAAPILQKLADA